MTIAKKKTEVVSFDDATFPQVVGEYSYSELLSNGVLVEVTSWVRREMGFSESRFQVQVAVTARLWSGIVRISPFAKAWQTIVGRGNDVLWLASYALRKARQVGSYSAPFQCFLPTRDEWGSDCVKHLRATMKKEDGKKVVTIGYADEFPLV